MSPRAAVNLVWAAAILVAAGAVLLWAASPEAVKPETHVPQKRGTVKRRPGKLAARPEGPPWMMLGGPRHTGRSPFPGPSEPRRRWTFTTGAEVHAQPVVGRDGTVYVGSLDRHLYALGPDGGMRFKVDTGGPIYGTAAVSRDGTIYVGSDADRVLAISPRGRILWMVETEWDADTGVAIGTEGEIYIGCGRDLLAIAPSGRVLWRFRTRDKVFSAPAVGDDGAVYFGSQDDYLYAVNADGSMRWRHRAGSDVDSAPAIGDDGTVFVGSDDGRVRALRRDGTLRWSATLGGAVRAGIALGRDGTVLVGTLGPLPRFVALDAASGAERWTFPLRPVGSRDVGIHSHAAVDRDGYVYFGANDDYLYSLDPSGSLRWVFETNGDVDSGPTIASDGTLVFGSDDHNVHAIR